MGLNNVHEVVDAVVAYNVKKKVLWFIPVKEVVKQKVTFLWYHPSSLLDLPPTKSPIDKELLETSTLFENTFVPSKDMIEDSLTILSVKKSSAILSAENSRKVSEFFNKKDKEYEEDRKEKMKKEVAASINQKIMDEASKGKTNAIFMNNHDFMSPGHVWDDLQVGFIIDNKEELLNRGFKVTEQVSNPEFTGNKDISIIVSWKVEDNENGKKN